MTDQCSPSLPPDDRFEAAVTEYLFRREQGQAPDAEQFLQRFPELADRLRQFFADQGLFDRRTRDLAPTMSRTPNRPGTGGVSLGSTAKDIPASVGRFLIREWLGEGAFGVVYRAVDPQLDREVALKVAKPASLTSSERVERFLREGKAAAQLRHPHIVPVFEAGRDGSSYYIASAYIKGRTLQETIFSGGIGEHRAVEVVRDIAEALAYAHTRGIVHRDVKPANILLDEQGQPLLTDFGLAARHELDEKLTQQGAILGTPLYMAPEQAAGSDGPALPASDQYSLGVVFYELLTGRTPFTGPAAVVLGNHGHLPPPEPGPAVPPELKKICLKTLAKVPGERFPDCEELARVLQRWLDTHPSGEQVPSSRPRLGRRPRLLLAAACGAAAVCFAVWGLWPKKGDEKPVAADNPASSGGPQRPATGRGEELPYQMRLRHTLPKEELPLLRVDVTPDGKTVASMTRKELGEDECVVVKVWDSLTGKPLCSFQTKKSPRGQMLIQKLSPDGKTVVTTGLTSTGKRDGSIEAQLWDARSGKELKTIPLPGFPLGYHWIIITPDSRSLVLVSSDEVKRLEVPSGVEQGSFTIPKVTGNIPSSVFSPDGKVLWIFRRDLYLWDNDQPKPRTILATELGMTDEVSYWTPTVSPDGKTIAYLAQVPSDDTSEFQFELTSVSRGKKLPALVDARFVSASPFMHPGVKAFSPDGKTLAGGMWSEDMHATVRLWDVTTGRVRATLRGHGTPAEILVYSADGNRLISALHDKGAPIPPETKGRKRQNEIKLWDTSTGRKLAEVTWPPNPLKGSSPFHVAEVRLSPDGRTVLATNGGELLEGSGLSAAMIWDLVPNESAK